MFTKEDLLHYLEQVHGMEKKMEEIYLHIHNGVNHSEYKHIFGRLIEDERKHKHLVEEIMAFLSKQK